MRIIKSLKINFVEVIKWHIQRVDIQKCFLLRNKHFWSDHTSSPFDDCRQWYVTILTKLSYFFLRIAGEEFRNSSDTFLDYVYLLTQTTVKGLHRQPYSCSVHCAATPTRQTALFCLSLFEGAIINQGGYARKQTSVLFPWVACMCVANSSTDRKELLLLNVNQLTIGIFRKVCPLLSLLYNFSTSIIHYKFCSQYHNLTVHKE